MTRLDSKRRLRMVSTLLSLLALGCAGPPEEQPVASAPQSRAPSPSASADAAATPASVDPASPSAVATTSSNSAEVRAPTAGATLDATKSREALLEYRQSLARRCASDMPVAASPGFSAPEKALLCVDPNTAGVALASGALRVARADEVLLDVPSGLDGAEGDRALLLMRRTAGQYRMVEQLAIGKGFSAAMRVATQTTDVLLLCAHRGSMGLYGSTCGFLGEGTFQPGSGGDTRNEIELVSTTECGKSSSVELGEPWLDADSLQVPLLLNDVDRAPAPDDAGDLCSRVRSIRTRTLTVVYRIKGARAVRQTIPFAEVDRIVRAH